MAKKDDIENRLKTMEEKIQRLTGMILLIDDVETRLKRLERKMEARGLKRGDTFVDE